MSVFDPAELERLTGMAGAELLPLLVSYRKNQRSIESQLRGLGSLDFASEDVDVSALGALAHRLKSAARTVGARELADASEALEFSVRDGDRELTPLLASVLEGIEKVDSAIDCYLSSMKKEASDVPGNGSALA